MKFYALLILLCSFTLNATTVAAAPMCVQFLKQNPPSRRVNWNLNYEPILNLLIQHYGAERLTHAFVSKLSKTDLAFITEQLNLEVSGTSIIAQAKILHGSWYKALEAHGVSTARIQSNYFSLTTEQILVIIKQLSENHNLTSSSVRKLENISLTILDPQSTHTIRGDAFYNQVTSKFESWDAALIAAGLNPSHVKTQFPVVSQPRRTPPPPKWNTENRALIIRLLRERFGDENLNTKFVNELTAKDLSFISEQVGFEVTGPKILGAHQLRYFGSSWYDALKDHGVNIDALARRNFLSLNELSRLITEIHQARNLEENGLVSMTALEVFQITGLRISGAALHRQIRDKSEVDWYTFVKQIGLDIKPPTPMPAEQIIFVIQEFAKTQNPNFRNFLYAQNELSHLNLKVKNHTIIQHAIREFGSWDAALVASGFNPDHVRLTGFAPYQVLTPAMRMNRQRMVEHAIEFQQEGWGFEFNNQNLERVRITNRTAEVELQQKEVSNGIEGALRSLSAKEQSLFDLLTDKMVEMSLKENYEGFDLPTLIREITTSHREITQIEVINLLQKIKDNNELKEILFPEVD